MIRIAAYCQLIEACEGADSPFGVLMFAGSYDCVIIPNSSAAHLQLDLALDSAREFVLSSVAAKRNGEKLWIDAPTDNRCNGCHFGKPRKHQLGSATILEDKEVTALPTRAANGKSYHCDCGDRFTWVPPHKDAVALEIAKPR
jgi:hypothetical protein